MRKKRTLFDFLIAQRRFYRQRGQCALCGKRLTLKNRRIGEPGAWHAHHIDGDPTNSVFTNCAVVCAVRCHLRAHCGEFGGPFVVGKRSLRLRGWRELGDGGLLAA